MNKLSDIDFVYDENLPISTFRYIKQKLFVKT